jgi:hypothetical protein
MWEAMSKAHNLIRIRANVGEFEAAFDVRDESVLVVSPDFGKQEVPIGDFPPGVVARLRNVSMTLRRLFA